LEWRSPFLVDIRHQVLMGLIGVPVVLILANAWVLRTVPLGHLALRLISALGMLIALLVLTITLALEARFNWTGYQVLSADSSRLERLGGHLIVGYRDSAEIQELVRHRAVAGVFLSGWNANGKTAAAVRQEIRALQRERKAQGLPPLWIATDQEGGIVSRLSPPLTRLSALSEIVEQNPDPVQREHAVREFARTQGRELAEIGVNLNFAPVVDVNHRVINPNDRYTRITQRAISSDPKVVAQVASWYCAALEEVGVRCTLKHFPGLGRVFEDTHREHASLSTSVEELTSSDWLPFRTLMSRGNAFTMLGHVRLAAVDRERPASFSAPVVAGLLRGQWKYDGVLITDNFTMAAVYHTTGGIDEASIAALNAGVDLILISYDPDQYYRVMFALLKADEQGRLNRGILQQSDVRLARAAESLTRWSERYQGMLSRDRGYATGN
jgi:beta-N-acetylhexosaminidase